MPGQSGFAATRQMRAALPSLRVVLVSALDDHEFRAMAREAGAVAFLSKKRLNAAALLALLDETT
jgi:DNA-binding NarL/FixJ family response regulator